VPLNAPNVRPGAQLQVFDLENGTRDAVIFMFVAH